MSMDRRQVLQTGVVGIVAATSGSVAVATNPLPEIPITDTHVHLWDLDHLNPPWLKNASPKISGAHVFSDYQRETAGLNITRAIYMEVDVAPVDHDREADYVVSLISQGHTTIQAAVISGRPAEAQFADSMQRYRNHPLIKGVRQVLHGSTPQGYCLQPQFVKSMQLLGEMDLSFDLCMRPTELDDAVKLVRQCPETRFVLDHLGNADYRAWLPGDAAADALHTPEQWQRQIDRLAGLPNVACKVSGIVHRVPEGWDADLLAPAINYCLDAFGPDRVVFGGDWPVCKLGDSIAAWVIALKQIVTPRPVAVQRALFHENANVWYRMKTA